MKEHIYQFIRSGNTQLAWQLDEGQCYGIREHLQQVFQPFLREYTFDELFTKDVLYLNDMSLDFIPPEIGLLPQLEYLNLSDNKLTTTPKELGDLPQLKWLYLDNNNLTSIPQELGNLSQLKRLYLRGNPLPQDVADKIREMLPSCEVYF